MRRDTQTTADTHPARCLLLAPRGHDVPPDLLDGLRQRGVTLREVNDAPSAMVALAEQAFGVMVIVSPGVQREADALARAVRRYHPGVGLWRYAADGHPRLARLTVRDNGTGLSRGAAANQPPPDPRDTAEHGAEDRGHDAHDPSMHLTREELAMLLDQGEGHSERRHTGERPT